MSTHCCPKPQQSTFPSTCEDYHWYEKLPRINQDGKYSHSRTVVISGEHPLPRVVVKTETWMRRGKGLDEGPHADEVAYKVCKLFHYNTIPWNTIPKTKVLHQFLMLSENPPEKLQKYLNLMRCFVKPGREKELPRTFTFQGCINGWTLYERRNLPIEVEIGSLDLQSFQKAFLLTNALGCFDSRDDNILFDPKSSELFLVDNEHIGGKHYETTGYLNEFGHLMEREISSEILDAVLNVDFNQFSEIRKKYEARDKELLALWTQEYSSCTFKEDKTEILVPYLDNIESNLRALKEAIHSLKLKGKPITLVSLKTEMPPPPKQSKPLADASDSGGAGLPLSKPHFFKTAPIPLPQKIIKPFRSADGKAEEDLLSRWHRVASGLEAIKYRVEKNLPRPISFSCPLGSDSEESEGEASIESMEGRAQALRECIQHEDPLSFRFALDSADQTSLNLQEDNVYTPIEYAVRLNDFKSLQYLLGRTENFPDSLPFFYMECLQEKSPPNLDILKLLLSRISNINLEREIDGEIENLLGYAVYCMDCFHYLHLDVIEELFKQGAKVSKTNPLPPFELLKICRIPHKRSILKLTKRIFLDPKGFPLPFPERISIGDSRELFLNRLYQYEKLERKYDPQPSSRLTFKEFFSEKHHLEQSFQGVQICSDFLNAKTQAPREMFFLSIEWRENSATGKKKQAVHGSSADSAELCKDDNFKAAVTMTLHVFYDKMMKHSLFFNALVHEGKFEDCFKRRQIEDLTASLAYIMNRFPLQALDAFQRTQKTLPI